MRREVGLTGAVTILVGFIIGATIFILPGPLAGQAGPSVFIAIGVAILPAVFVGLFNAQLGSAWPISGGNYVYISRLLSSSLGFLGIWTLLIGVYTGLTMVATGFAEYIGFFINIPAIPAIIGIVLIFLTTNLLGIKLTERVQTLMIIIFFATIFLFIIPGFFSIDTSNWVPLFPKGMGPFFMAMASFYFSYIGFTVITEIGDEIKNPSRNIPIAIGISLALVASVYFLLTFVLTGVMNWQTLGQVEAAVAVASRVFLPKWGASIIAIGAIFSIATTVNSILTVYSRTVMSGAKDLAFPEVFGRVSDRFGTPYMALFLLGLPTIPIIALQPSIPLLTMITVMSVLFVNALTAGALYYLPKEYPEKYESSDFKLGKKWIPFVSIGGIIVSIIFIILGSVEAWQALVILLVWLAIGAVVYKIRKRFLADRGIDLQENMTTLRKDVEN